MKKTFDWLKERGTEYEFIDVKKAPLTKDEIAHLAHIVGLDTLVNRKGMTWRKLGLSGQDLSDAELIDLLVEHQTMIKRPVVVKDHAVIVGFDEDALSGFIEEYA